MSEGDGANWASGIFHFLSISTRLHHTLMLSKHKADVAFVGGRVFMDNMKTLFYLMSFFTYKESNPKMFADETGYTRGRLVLV